MLILKHLDFMTCSEQQEARHKSEGVLLVAINEQQIKSALTEIVDLSTGKDYVTSKRSP